MLFLLILESFYLWRSYPQHCIVLYSFLRLSINAVLARAFTMMLMSESKFVSKCSTFLFSLLLEFNPLIFLLESLKLDLCVLWLVEWVTSNIEKLFDYKLY